MNSDIKKINQSLIQSWAENIEYKNTDIIQIWISIGYEGTKFQPRNNGEPNKAMFFCNNISEAGNVV